MAGINKGIIGITTKVDPGKAEIMSLLVFVGLEPSIVESHRIDLTIKCRTINNSTPLEINGKHNLKSTIGTSPVENDMSHLIICNHSINFISPDEVITECTKPSNGYVCTTNRSLPILEDIHVFATRILNAGCTAIVIGLGHIHERTYKANSDLKARASEEGHLHSIHAKVDTFLVLNPVVESDPHSNDASLIIHDTHVATAFVCAEDFIILDLARKFHISHPDTNHIDVSNI